VSRALLRASLKIARQADQTVFDSFSQWHDKVCHFISDIMDNFLAGKAQQQISHPNAQAGD